MLETFEGKTLSSEFQVLQLFECAEKREYVGDLTEKLKMIHVK
jgi:hypothetical protein